MISSGRELLLAALVFTVLALAFGAPLPLHMGDGVPVSGTPLDAMHILYAVTWGSQILGNNPFEFFNATFFHPYNNSLAFMDHMAGVSALIAPINWASGSMYWGFNMAWLGTFVLSGLGAYLLTRHLTDCRSAAFLAGIAYAYFPFRYHNAGQLNVLAMMWIPFALLSLHVWVDTHRRRHLLWFVIFASLQFLSSLYTGVFLFLCVGLYLIVLLTMDRPRTMDLVRKQSWAILSAVMLGLVSCFPFVAPYLTARRETGLRRALGESGPFSAIPLDFITPAPQSILGGVVPWGDSARHALFPGIVVCLLIGIWIARRGWRTAARPRTVAFYTLLAVIAMLLSLGPVLGDTARIPMPFALAYYVLPGASFIRAPVRFALLGSLGLAVLAAMGLASLRRDTRVRRARNYALAGLAALELFAAPITMFQPLPPGGIPRPYYWLGSVSGELAVVDIPMAPDEAGESIEHARYQLYSLVHGKRIVNGVAAYVPPITRELREVMQSFPSDQSVARLRNLGVSYAFVHSEQYSPEDRRRLADAVLASPGLNVVDMDGPIWILDIVPHTVPAYDANGNGR